MKKRIANDPLTEGKHMHGYKQKVVPWLGKDRELTMRRRITCSEAILNHNDAFFCNMVYEDEKKFTQFGILNRQNAR